MKKRKIWGLGFYIQSGKKTAYPTAGRPPGRPVEAESNLGFSRSTARSTGFGQKNFQAISVDWVGRPSLYQARSIDRAGRLEQLKTRK